MFLRSAFIFLAIFTSFLSRLMVIARDTSIGDCLSRIDQELGAKLSSKASIVHYTSAAPRWSDYHAPTPGSIVNVAEEQDVIETVKYCIKNNLAFLAQSGAHASATTFNIHEKDVIINLRGLNQVSVSDAGDTITIGGGSLISEVVEAAYEKGVQVVTGNCNCVGALGATLGGGLGRLMGRYGLAADNLLSVNLVTADGKLITVTPTSSPDLWWAIRGAGANFGIVTSATLKAYPTVNNGMAWIATLIYTPDKLEAIVQYFNDLDFEKEMATHLIFAASPPDFAPIIIVRPWYSGTEAEGIAAFKGLFDLDPIIAASGELPYNQINSGDDGFCVKGGRKSAYTVGLKKLDPETFRKVFNEYASILKVPGLEKTAMLVECYSYKTVRKFADSSSAFPHRRVNFHAVVGPWYDDAKLDRTAENFAKKVRNLWRDNSGFEEYRAYVNFSHGDESITAIYGENLSRLKKIKKNWDKSGRFSQFFPIK